MQLKHLVVTTLCTMLTAAPVFAKEKKHEKAMDPQEMMEVWKKLAQPGEPHKLFASLAGSWTTQTKEWMESGKPPSESTGCPRPRRRTGRSCRPWRKARAGR